jgi:hypothetical protein
MRNTSTIGVIPAKAGLSTAELVIHFALEAIRQIKMDSRFRGNDDMKNRSSPVA